MWRGARDRAKKHGVPFTITIADIVIPEYCPVFNIQLVRAVGVGKQLDTSPSLDRINNKLGYVPGNVQVISNKANAMKSNATIEELHMFSNWIRNAPSSST